MRKHSFLFLTITFLDREFFSLSFRRYDKKKILSRFLLRVFQDLVPVLSLRQKPKKIQKNVRFGFSTGTKSSKTAQKTFQKTVKMYFVPATNLKNKKKFITK
jgi:hypothetical protein